MKKIINIVGFGDSITQAIINLNEQERWLSLLHQSLRQKFPEYDFTVVNSGVGGNTSREGLARIETDVIAHRPDIVLVEFGGNDAVDEELRHVTLEEFKTNLAKIHQIVTRKTSARVVMLTFTPVINEWHAFCSHDLYKELGMDGYVEQYRKITRDFAAENHLPLIDIDLALRAAMKKDGNDVHIQKDGVHLTASGCRILAEAIFPGLCDIISSL
jgi:lysophospholipase L1-like esterase